VRALLLDLDDTLFDRTAALARWNADRVPFPWLLEVDERGRRSRVAFCADLARRGIPVTPDEFPHQLAACVEPEAGARETIQRLARTHRVAVVTNGGPAQRTKLANAALADVVHAVFVSSEPPCHDPGRGWPPGTPCVAKPAAAMFERALRWAEVPPEDCLFVGDDPVVDLAAAAALDMTTAWRVRGSWPRELARPRYEIHAIAELEAIL